MIRTIDEPDAYRCVLEAVAAAARKPPLMSTTSGVDEALMPRSRAIHDHAASPPHPMKLALSRVTATRLSDARPRTLAWMHARFAEYTDPHTAAPVTRT